MSSSGNLPSIELVVVGVDASETALAAAREAAALALQLGARLHIVSAIVSDGMIKGGTGTDAFTSTGVDRAEQVLADIASRLPEDLETTTIASSGKPADVIIAEAERLEADLIVVGSKRMTGIGRVLGSVANEIAHQAPCSVHIAKTTA